MTGFVDVYLPDQILGYGFQSSPRWSTTITAVASGAEHRNRNWAHPLHRFTAPEGIRCWEDVEALHRMWMAFAGPLYTFPFRDPLDFASRALTAPQAVPPIAETDQVLGVGDGLTRTFQLRKAYTFGPLTYTRPIFHPILDSVLVAMNALPADTAAPTLPGGPYTWDVDRLTGLVEFTPAPTAGVVITAGFLFDVEARFEGDDSYDGIVHAYQTAGFADLSFLEVRPC